MKTKLLLAAAGIVLAGSAFATDNYPYKCPALNQIPASLSQDQTFSANGVTWMSVHGMPYSKEERAQFQSFNMASLDYGTGGPSPAFSCTYVANGTFQYYPTFIAYPGGVNYSLNPAQFTPKDGSSSRTCGLVHPVGGVDDCTFGPPAR